MVLVKVLAHDIYFPFEPYPSQLAVMSAALRSCNNKVHSILESPTGSGKTLSLLCSTLAWQDKYKKIIHEEIVKEAKENVEKIFKLNNSTNNTFITSTSHSDALINANNSDLIEHKRALTTSEKYEYEQKLFESEYNKLSKLKKKIKIYYTSRTHSQIDQVINELKRTSYKPKISILASREQYCIHPKVSISYNKNEDCKQLRDFKPPRCGFFNFTPRKITHPDFLPGGDLELFDIEELVSFGRRTKTCPYFTARTLAEDADCDLILCPYNYILDPSIAKSMKIDLKDSIVIIDEAHNIEDVCRDTISSSILLVNLKILIADFVLLINLNILTEKHEYLRTLVEKLMQYVMDAPNNNAKSGICLVEIFNKMGINSTTISTIKTTANEAIEDSNERVNINLKQLSGPAVSILELLVLLLGFAIDAPKDYRVVVLKEGSDEDEYKLCFWCMNPALSFNLVASQARSVILTSGTLSPMPLLMTELGTSFPVTLEAPHVIKQSQISVTSLGRGPPTYDNPNGTLLKATFENTDSSVFQDAIGSTLLKLSNIIPNGILVFFNSYMLIEKLLTRWRGNGILERINATKRVIVEPKGADKFDLVMEVYCASVRMGVNKDLKNTSIYINDLHFLEKIDIELSKCLDINEDNNKAPRRFSGNRFTKKRQQQDLVIEPRVDSQNGAIFFAVFRGKISEGIDFSDEYCRGVVNVGIPFANVKDQQVQLKRDYNSDRCSEAKRLGLNPVLDGNQWFNLRAYRALNQAVGRCIRHRNDFGAVILLDDRFTDEKIRPNLSRWVRDRVENRESLEEALISIVDFFNTNNDLEQSFKRMSVVKKPDTSPKKSENKFEKPHKPRSFHEVLMGAKMSTKMTEMEIDPIESSSSAPAPQPIRSEKSTNFIEADSSIEDSPENKLKSDEGDNVFKLERTEATFELKSFNGSNLVARTSSNSFKKIESSKLANKIPFKPFFPTMASAEVNNSTNKLEKSPEPTNASSSKGFFGGLNLNIIEKKAVENSNVDLALTHAKLIFGNNYDQSQNICSTTSTIKLSPAFDDLPPRLESFSQDSSSIITSSSNRNVSNEYKMFEPPILPTQPPILHQLNNIDNNINNETPIFKFKTSGMIFGKR